MIITIAGIINARSAIEKLTSQNLPARKAFNIAKLLKHLSEEYELFEKTRIELVKKYGTINDEGNWVADTQDPEFMAEIQNLITTEIEISDALRVDLSSEIDSLEFTVTDLIAIEPFFQFEQPESK